MFVAVEKENLGTYGSFLLAKAMFTDAGYFLDLSVRCSKAEQEYSAVSKQQCCIQKGLCYYLSL